MTKYEWLTSDDPVQMLAELLGGESVSAAGIPYHSPGLLDLSGRKLRLFACACCRQVWHLLTDDAPCGRCEETGVALIEDDIPRTEEEFEAAQDCPDCGGTGRVNRSRRAVEVAERYADAEVTGAELEAARVAAVEARRPTMDAATWRIHYAACLTAEVATFDAEHVAYELRRRAMSPAAQAALLREVVGNPLRPVTLSDWPYLYAWQTPLALAQAAYEERLADGILDPDRLGVLADALEDAGCTDQDILNHLRGFERSDPTTWVTLRSPHVRGCHVVDLLLGKD